MCYISKGSSIFKFTQSENSLLTSVPSLTISVSYFGFNFDRAQLSKIFTMSSTLSLSLIPGEDQSPLKIVSLTIFLTVDPS